MFTTSEAPPIPAMIDKAAAVPGSMFEHVGKLVFLIAAMKWLEYTIQQQYGGGPIFDARIGYTPAEAAGTLSTWGTIGRLLYLVIEGIDTFAFIGLFRALQIRVYRTYLGGMDWVNLLPIFSLTAYSDLLENAGQVLMTMLYEAHMGSMPWFPLVARVASGANIVKWYSAGCGIFLMGVLFTYKMACDVFPGMGNPAKAPLI
jgi:hypothetical protein